MSAIDLATAQAQLDAWLAASIAVAKGQSYTIGTRTLTRADSSKILEQVKFWESKVNTLTNTSGAGGARVRYGVPEG